MTRGDAAVPGGAERFGCEAFGHLASPFVDGELRPADQERFATHLPTCEPCKSLTSEWRALDALASPPVPMPSAARWDAAWEAIRAQREADRAAEEASPLAPVLRLLRGPAAALRGSRALRPLGYAAAAALVLAAVLSIQRATDPGVAVRPRSLHVARVAEPAKVLSIACAAPDYMPVVYTTGDADGAVTVVQCAYVGSGT